MYMCGCHTHKAITICIYIYIYIYCDGWGIFDLYTNVWCRHLLNESYIRKQKKLLLACNNGENTFLLAANNVEMKFSFIKKKNSVPSENGIESSITHMRCWLCNCHRTRIRIERKRVAVVIIYSLSVAVIFSHFVCAQHKFLIHLWNALRIKGCQNEYLKLVIWTSDKKKRKEIFVFYVPLQSFWNAELFLSRPLFISRRRLSDVPDATNLLFLAGTNCLLIWLVSRL